MQALGEQLLGQNTSDLLLLDSRLNQAAAGRKALLDRLATQRQTLAGDALTAPLAACSDNELAQLRAWLNKPSASQLQGTIAQLLGQRQQAYQTTLPPEQASVASMIELSLALTWSQRA